MPPVTTLGACTRSPAQWAERCAGRTGVEVFVEGCADGVAVFALPVSPETGHTHLRVEVKPSLEPGLRNVGPFRIVPIGQFGDWASEPEALRVPFDQLVSCVEEDLGLEVDVFGPLEEHESLATGVQRDGRAGSQRPIGFAERVDFGPPPVPWRLFGGLGLLALAAALTVRRRDALDVVVAVSVLVVTFALRVRVFPEAHFHQNGQGPLWVEYALGLAGSYGPGFREVFGIWVSGAHDPDGALFAAQGVFAASGVAALYVAVRAVGAPRMIAAALALSCVLDPALGRLARGESYFGIWTSLIGLATAGVAGGCAAWVSGASMDGDGVGTRRAAWVRDPRLIAMIGVAGAGLLIAQGARIHPLGWPAAAVVPLVVLTFQGPWWRRVACTAVVGVGIGVVVAATSLPAMLDVLTGELGSKWMPAVGGEHRHIPFDALVGAFLATFALGAIGSGLVRRGRTGAGRVFDAAALFAMIALVVAVHDAVNLLGGTKPHVVWGNAMMYASVPFVAIGAAATRLLPRGATASVVVAILVTGVAGFLAESRWEEVTTLPTDAREASLVRQWREDLPPGGVVYYVERAHNYVARLPIYGVTHGVRRQTIDPGADVEHVVSPGTGRLWYRSSLCSATVAADVCAEVERVFVLEPIHEAELPARPSMEDNDYVHVPVRIGFYRVVSMRGDGAPASPEP